MSHTDAFWQVTAIPPEDTPPLAQDLKVDVAVVGAGFTGLRAALDVAEAGTNVAVFEAGDVAQGASGRSGGQVNPMLPCPQPADLRKAVGDTYFERMAHMSLRSADDLFEMIEKYQIQCQARQKGWVRADHCKSAQAVSHRNAKLWNAHGAGFELIDSTQVRDLTGAHGYVSGVVSQRGGAVQPLSLTRGLAKAAISAGAAIHSHSPVTKLERKGTTWHMQVGQHRVQAKTVIIATNGYTDALVGGLKTSVMPLTSVQMSTNVLDEARLGPLLRKGHTISDTRRMIIYCRREPGGQFLFGGMGFRTPLGGAGGFGWMMKDAVARFPILKGATWTHQWSGRIALTPDRVPHLHEPEPGLIAGLGYNGRGVAMSSVMGREMARRALGAAQEDLPMPTTRIARYPFRLPQVLGAGLAMAWLRFRDEHEARSAQRMG
jgi:glycine/D-amino acid oxidase-like deaminating enzyme